MLQARVSPSTAHQHFRALRTLFRWAVEIDLLEDVPTRGLRLIVPRTFPKVPTAEEVHRLIEAASPRLRPIITLLADSGLRVSEALGLRVGDVDLSSRTLTIREGKGQRDRIGFIGETAAGALAALLEGRHSADLVFCHEDGSPFAPAYVTHALHRLCDRIGLPRRYGAHSLRHFVGTTLVRTTGDLEVARRVLGHSTLAMTLRYAHMSDADVRERFSKASPIDNIGR